MKTIRSIAIALCLALAAGNAAHAQGLSLASQGDVLVTANGSTIIGWGGIVNGKLTLELASGYSGFVQLIVADASGEMQVYEAAVRADGSVVLFVNGDIRELDEAFAGSGVEIRVTYGSAAASARGNGLARALLGGSAAMEEAGERAADAGAGVARASERLSDTASSASDRAREALDGSSDARPGAHGRANAAANASANARVGADADARAGGGGSDAAADVDVEIDVDVEVDVEVDVQVEPVIGIGR